MCLQCLYTEHTSTGIKKQVFSASMPQKSKKKIFFKKIAKQNTSLFMNAHEDGVSTN